MTLDPISYSEADLKIIRWKRPDLKIQRPEKYSLDQIIIEFLKKYEVKEDLKCV